MLIGFWFFLNLDFINYRVREGERPSERPGKAKYENSQQTYVDHVLTK